MNGKHFPKKMRLLHLNEFAFVLRKSKFVVRCNGIASFSYLNQLEYPRIGLSISKKYVKYAHERNRIKRYARETFRMNQHNLLHLDFVLTVYSTAVLYLNNNNLIKEFEKLWHHYWC